MPNRSHTAEEIQENYEAFMTFIGADSRSEALIQMYDDIGDLLYTAPASGKVHYHTAFPGGYLDHVLRVARTALRVASLYKDTGGEIDFTKEELIFAALHHDLGKLGDSDGPYYVDQESDWHQKRGELYTQNDNLQYFKPPERGLSILASRGIPVTPKEWLAIKLSDGLYDEGNKSYYVNYAPYAMKTNLPYIIHWADHLSSQVENDMTRF